MVGGFYQGLAKNGGYAYLYAIPVNNLSTIEVDDIRLSSLLTEVQQIYNLLIKNKRNIKNSMVEVLLSGLVLGLVPVTITGLFVAAYLQYRRGNQFGL